MTFVILVAFFVNSRLFLCVLFVLCSENFETSARNGDATAGVRGRQDVGTAETDVGESRRGHGLGLKEVATINDDGVEHLALEPRQVERRELGPLGQDEQGMCALRRLVRVLRELN